MNARAMHLANQFSRLMHRQNKVKRLRPYQYLLKYTYTPRSWSRLYSYRDLQLHQMKSVFKRLYFQTHLQQINTQEYHKALKAHIIALHNLKRLNPQNCSGKMTYFLLRLYRINFDYKWSSISEENVIIMLIDIITDYESIFKEEIDEAICRLLLYFIAQNYNLQEAIHKLCEEDIDTSVNIFNLFKDNQDGFIKEKFTMPDKLLSFMDRSIMYTSGYNFQLWRRKGEPLGAKYSYSYQPPSSAQEKSILADIIEQQGKYIQNIKISRLDYLTATYFILGLGMFDKKLLMYFLKYLRNDLETIQRSVSPVTRFLQVMMICKVLQTIATLHQKKIIYKGDLCKKHHQRYSKLYKRFLQEADALTLYALFKHPSALFPKYIPFNLLNSSQESSLQTLYLSILHKVLDSYENGSILLEVADLNPLFDALLVLLSVKDEVEVLRVMQKYEFLCLKTCGHDSSLYKCQSAYILMVKHSLKSDIIAERLHRTMQHVFWQKSSSSLNLSSYIQSLSDFKKYDNLFFIYLYLSIAQTPTQLTAKAQEFLLSQILISPLWKTQPSSSQSPQCLDFCNAIDTSLQKVKGLFKKGCYIDSLQEIIQLSKYLMLLQMAIEINQKKEIDERNSNKLQLTQIVKQLIKDQERREAIKDHISYPGLLQSLVQVLAKVGDTDEIDFAEQMVKLAQQAYHSIGEQKHTQADFNIPRFFYQPFVGLAKYIQLGLAPYNQIYQAKHIHKTLNQPILLNLLFELKANDTEEKVRRRISRIKRLSDSHQIESQEEEKVRDQQIQTQPSRMPLMKAIVKKKMLTGHRKPFERTREKRKEEDSKQLTQTKKRSLFPSAHAMNKHKSQNNFLSPQSIVIPFKNAKARVGRAKNQSLNNNTQTATHNNDQLLLINQ